MTMFGTINHSLINQLEAYYEVEDFLTVTVTTVIINQRKRVISLFRHNW